MSSLLQYYLLAPLNQKDAYLIHLANSLAQNSIIVFTRTVHDTQRLVFFTLMCCSNVRTFPLF